MPDDGSYQLLDAGEGERLEEWGPYRLRRPDPRAIGRRVRATAEWREVDAWFRGEAGRGQWERLTAVPESWTIEHGGLTLVVKLAPFKHTGVFPEQAAHWHWMLRAASAVANVGPSSASVAAGPDAPPPAVDAPESFRTLRVLNLFAYTGGASVALAKAGHHVTHVDASKPALAWARENAAANGLAADAIRWIQDDAATFVRRELRRGKRYDAALMDPPAFGHAPRGGVWRVDDQLAPLIADTGALLAEPVFFLVNHYARDAEPRALAEAIAPPIRNVVGSTRGRFDAGRLTLQTTDGRALDTGAYVRWHAQ